MKYRVEIKGEFFTENDESGMAFLARYFAERAALIVDLPDDVEPPELTTSIVGLVLIERIEPET